jgi:hypothetical protein
MLADPQIKGVILTVPNEQHLPLAREVAKARKHVYTEKPIASTLEEGLEIEALEKTYGVTVTVGHSARLMAGIRKIREAIDAGRAWPCRLHRGQLLERARARAHPQDVALVQGPAHRAGRCRSSRSITSTWCTISAARSSRHHRWRRSFRRWAPRSMTSR